MTVCVTARPDAETTGRRDEVRPLFFPGELALRYPGVLVEIVTVEWPVLDLGELRWSLLYGDYWLQARRERNPECALVAYELFDIYCGRGGRNA